MGSSVWNEQLVSPFVLLCQCRKIPPLHYIWYSVCPVHNSLAFVSCRVFRALKPEVTLIQNSLEKQAKKPVI